MPGLISPVAVTRLFVGLLEADPAIVAAGIPVVEHRQQSPGVGSTPRWFRVYEPVVRRRTSNDHGFDNESSPLLLRVDAVVSIAQTATDAYAVPRLSRLAIEALSRKQVSEPASASEEIANGNREHVLRIHRCFDETPVEADEAMGIAHSQLTFDARVDALGV